MKIFWSWQSDVPGKIGRHLVRDALGDAIEKLKATEEVEESRRDELHLDQDIQGITGSPDLANTIFTKIQKSDVVVADVTLVGETDTGKKLINSNVAIELGYALHACTDERLLLVFNEHYGKYEDLPFDLRHKGGGVVFDLAPEADRKKIAAVRLSLTDNFVRKLKPFVEGPLRVKEKLSIRAIVEHQLTHRHPMPGGGHDDVFELRVSVENDGENAAQDFKLQLDIPAEFVDGTPPGELRRPGPPGVTRLEITNEQGPARMKYLYPKTQSPTLIALNYAVRDQTKKQHPEQLEKKVIATVYSGSMTPKVTTMTIAELATIPNS